MAENYFENLLKKDKIHWMNAGEHTEADLLHANLSKAGLSEADLFYASFSFSLLLGL